MVKILDCFTAEEPAWSATLLAKELEIPVTTLYSILTDLVELDFLTQNPQTKEYKIGFRYMEMGALHSNNFELNNIAHGTMKELTLKVGHLVGLSVLYKGWMYVSMSILPFERASGFRYTGARFPAHLTAGGIAILAQLPPGYIDKYCVIDWGNTHVSPIEQSALEEHLLVTRETGYSIPWRDDDEQPIRSIGAPIFGRNRKVLGALVIIGPNEGLSDEEIATLSRDVIQGAGEITMRSAHLSGPDSYIEGYLAT